MDLITLAMPIYNVEGYVERALLSALNQTYENIEYLIVDDKGNDDSMKIVRNIISIHPRGENVRIIEHPVNLGAGGTRNSSIEQAKGQYLYFMDSDDEITPDCIRKLYEEMTKTSVDVVCGSVTTIKNMEIISSDVKNYTEKNKDQIILSYFDDRFPIAVWNKLYNLSFLRMNMVRCVSQQTIEDNYFTFQVLLNAKACKCIQDITYFYYVRNDSTTGGGWDEKVFKQWPQIFTDLSGLLEASTLSSELKLKVKRRLFKRRLGIAELAMKSPHPVQHYVNDYLSPAFFQNKDILHDFFLFMAYSFSCMPFSIKMICLRIHMMLTKKQ